MNTVVVDPAIRDFLEAVRRELTDLEPEERLEILEGLEADLSEQVAEQGADALVDPVAYARELRLAAGLPAAAGRAYERRSAGQWVTDLLDAAHVRWDRFLAGLPGGPAGFLEALRPAWWLVRAWVAVCLVLVFTGREANIAVVPSISGSAGLGALVLLVAVIVSVQLGRRRWWPADRRTALARTVLLAANVLAAALVVPMVSQQMTRADAFAMGNEAAAWTYYERGVHSNGAEVSNIFAYDAQGRALTGVQLFDQDGQPLEVAGEYPVDESQEGVLWTYPWNTVNGPAWNVFPLPVGPGDQDEHARLDRPWTSSTPPRLPTPDAASVTRATLPDQAGAADSENAPGR